MATNAVGSGTGSITITFSVDVSTTGTAVGFLGDGSVTFTSANDGPLDTQITLTTLGTVNSTVFIPAINGITSAGDALPACEQTVFLSD